MEAIRTLCHPHPWEEDAAVFASALGQLAEDAAMADLEDACKLSKAAREAGALQLCCDAVRHESARVHQPALAVLVCFTTTEVDPDAHLNRAIVSAHPRGFEGVVERLFSDVPLTVALACGALQNLCRTDVAHVAVLSACGGTERLRSLTMCGQDGIAVAANACLTNLLGWHRAASRVQLRYLRHQRRVMGMQLRRMSSLKTSLAEGRAAPTLIPVEEILLEEHSLATASPIASAHHGAGPPSMQVLTTAAKATPSPPSVCITLVLFNLVVSSADQADDAGGRSRAWSHSITDPRAPALPAPAPPPPPPPPVLLAEQSTIAAAAAEAQSARADAAMQKLVVARAAAAAAAAAEADAATAASSEPPAKKGPSLFKRAGRAVLTANALQLEQNQRRVEQIQRGVEERRRASELAAVTFRQAVASEQAAAAEAARLEAEEQTNARKAALEAALAEV